MRNIIEYLGIDPTMISETVNQEGIKEAKQAEKKYKAELNAEKYQYCFSGEEDRFYDSEKENMQIIEKMKHITVFEIVSKTK